MFDKIALVASVTLPLWNIPLLVRIIKRKSAKDISIFWASGVWASLVLMAPHGLMSDDVVWKAFNISNVSLFSVVFFTVIFYKVKERKVKA